ncbi:MAG: AhpC/TSA family protein [Prevotella sp.]|nr:AhpC/TSA family protein [Prevotella sp.]
MKIAKILPAAALALAALSITSCSNKKFHINGEIADAKDSTLFLENMSLNGPQVIDSVKLGEDGTFAFDQKATDAPEFYRLRIAGQIINLSIDSTETVEVKASYPTMTSQYEVKGSDNCSKIKELALMQLNLQYQINAVAASQDLDIKATADSIGRVLGTYKDFVKRHYIFKEPMKSYAYFALFQTFVWNGAQTLIFNPRSNKDDVKVFAAVATSWDVYHPKAERGQNLHNIAIEGMKNVKIIENQIAQSQIDASKVQVSNILDIALPDNNGHTRHLTELKGKVVLLDFHVFATKESMPRIMKLRELYNKYHAQGLEIYQVSVDPDEHFWKTQTEALPWICVRDADGIGSPNLVQYNVQGIPTYFLINKENAIYKRDAQIKDLDAEIRSLL